LPAGFGDEPASQRRLADTGLPADEDEAAAATAEGIESLAEKGLLSGAPEQVRPDGELLPQLLAHSGSARKKAAATIGSLP
jgi:hypothetical protein